jgi:hypothetical protein
MKKPNKTDNPAIHCAHDRHFAVSMSGIRTLPHQIEAVYLKRCCRSPGCASCSPTTPARAKPIMAGLLIKEMKLREAVILRLFGQPGPLEHFK